MQARGWCNTHYARWARTGSAGEAGLRLVPRDPTASTKCCTGCGEDLPVDRFYTDPRYPDRTLARCITCVLIATADSALRRRYGISAADRDAMILAQGGRCAVCPSTVRLVVDHDHRSGQVRGILCDRCNRALGVVDDDTDLIGSLIRYIHRPALRRAE